MARKFDLLLAGAGLMILAGCQTSEKLAATPAGPNVVNVVARDYHYEMPDSIPAGPTLFHLTNDGNELHHMTLVKLEQGKTLDDFSALPPGPMPSWAVFMGGPNAPIPHGGQSEDAVDLSPGNYAVICLIPGSDGQLHMMKGMKKALTVKPSSEAHTMPASDLTLTLADYQFAFSQPVTAGKHAIRVVNRGPQAHEAEIVLLQPGKTGKDVLAWVGGGFQGPPPGKPIGGIAPENNGHENVLMIDLEPGNYAILCFMPDSHDGRPHAAHGMIHDFQVL
jgi:hypothetical protein